MQIYNPDWTMRPATEEGIHQSVNDKFDPKHTVIVSDVDDEPPALCDAAIRLQFT